MSACWNRLKVGMATNTKISIGIFDHKVFEYSNIRPICACFANKELINALFAVKLSYCCLVCSSSRTRIYMSGQPVNLKENNVQILIKLIFPLLNNFLTKYVVLITMNMYTTEILLKKTWNVPNSQIFSKHDKSDKDPRECWMSLFE